MPRKSFEVVMIIGKKFIGAADKAFRKAFDINFPVASGPRSASSIAAPNLSVSSSLKSVGNWLSWAFVGSGDFAQNQNARVHLCSRADSKRGRALIFGEAIQSADEFGA